MKASGRSKDITVLVYSEFGRRVRGNGSDIYASMDWEEVTR